MANHAYIGEVLATVVYLIAGVRLLRLGQRTGETPERLLGGAFLFMGVSAGLYVLPVFSAFESLWTPLVFAGRVTYSQEILREFGWTDEGRGVGIDRPGSGYSRQ